MGICSASLLFSAPYPTQSKVTLTMAHANTTTFIAVASTTHMHSHRHTQLHSQLHTQSHKHSLTHTLPSWIPQMSQTLRKWPEKGKLNGKAWELCPSPHCIFLGTLTTRIYSIFHHHLSFTSPQVSTSDCTSTSTDTVTTEEKNLWGSWGWGIRSPLIF